MTDEQENRPEHAFLDALDEMADARHLLELIAMAHKHCKGDSEAAAVGNAAHMAMGHLERAEDLFNRAKPALYR